MHIMAARGENGWQSEKTLAECMRYMLDNEILTDVCFEVGPTDGATVKIRAHEYMLTARSPVFEAMFNSDMTECIGDEAKVRVEDIDAEVFKELLNYIYSESASMCPESAVYLMYAANKYMLPKLVTECGKCLLDGLAIDNVIQILEHALLFHDEKLTTECLKLISMNSKAVFTGVEILYASRQVMDVILEMENIPLTESVIYETSIHWAKHQLWSASLVTENPTDLQIREILGDLVHKIRFPTMKPHIFAEISSDKDILTAEEKESIYYFLATKKKGSRLLFPTERRSGEEVWVDRTGICIRGQWRSTPGVDAINFSTNKDILLTGIGLYTGYNVKGYDVDVEILRSTTSLFKTKVAVPYTGDANPFKISCDEPIFIAAGVVHSVKALAHDLIGYYGQPCVRRCTEGKVTFTFTKNLESASTLATFGQIPRFYFCYL